jgi:hypothetical protein
LGVLSLGVLRGRKGKIKEGKGRKGRERRKEGNYSPYLGVEKPTSKEIESLCDNFTILHFFLLKSIHCVILFCSFWE